MKDAFKNFSGEDYIQGACLTLENAQNHIRASELLFKDDNIGIAISHLILGVEEYIKSFILLCLSGDREFITDDEKIELFKNHKFKHNHITLFLKSISDTEVSKFDEELFDRFVNGTPNPFIYSMDGLYINKVFQFVKLDDDKLSNLENWFNGANDLKNRGFYLGVKDNWESPEIFTKEDFNKAFECIQIIRDAIEPMFKMPLSDDTFLDYLNRNFLT